ncbi:hypothetical protein [Micromonospora sp. NPDC051006]|uniref:hypothetical protein n=1 Tax=Micromonospora sp. NPDC051006 TaxID=3364283 RepID=UPI0037963731
MVEEFHLRAAHGGGTGTPLLLSQRSGLYARIPLRRKRKIVSKDNDSLTRESGKAIATEDTYLARWRGAGLTIMPPPGAP